MGDKEHWNSAYASRSHEDLSWYQTEPTTSLAFVEACLADPNAIIADIGGGASLLVDHLLDRGFREITVLDISNEAISQARRRLGPRAADVRWRVGNVTEFDPERPIDLWHDRAALHFLIDENDRNRYRSVLERSLAADGTAIIATFATNGPARCSGLPVVRYGPEEMRVFLGPRFHLVDCVRETHTTPGGVEQAFMYFHFRRQVQKDLNQ